MINITRRNFIKFLSALGGTIAAPTAFATSRALPEAETPLLIEQLLLAAEMNGRSDLLIEPDNIALFDSATDRISFDGTYAPLSTVSKRDIYAFVQKHAGGLKIQKDRVYDFLAKPNNKRVRVVFTTYKTPYLVIRVLPSHPPA